MITIRLSYKVHKWRVALPGFSQAGPGWIHFHNWVALSRSRGLSHSAQDVPRRQLRKGTLSLLGSIIKCSGAALQGRSSNIPSIWDSLYYAGDQSSPNAVLSAKLRFSLGFVLLMVALAPLPVSAEGRDDGEHSLYVETFETLKEGYCYDKASYTRWEWVRKVFCDSRGGVLLAEVDCKKSVKQGGSTFCTMFKPNDRFKEANIEFNRKKRLRDARARKDIILRAKKILTALGYYQGGRPKSSSFGDGLSRAISDFLESTSVTLKGEPVYTDALGRRSPTSDLMEKLNEADKGYCFSPPYGKPQAVTAPWRGWCLKSSTERVDDYARLSSVADCAADQGFLLPRDACRTFSGSICKIFNFDAAAAVLRETEGEKEIHFASNATQCIDQGGLLISEKDCAEKSTTTTLLRREYCRRIPAERLSAIKARWLAATGYCFLGKKPYSRKARSACRDAGGIVMAPRHCGAFSGSGGETSSVCMSLSAPGDVYVRTELASRDGAGDAQATNVAKADKQPEEKNTGEADQALTAAEQKKRQQEVVDVDPLVGVWDTGSGSEPRRFLAFKINDVGKYGGITWQRATPEGLEGYWSGQGRCRHTMKPDYYRKLSFKVSRNTIENVQIKGVSRITAKLGDKRISIKGRWSYQEHSDWSYFSGSTTLSKNGRLRLSGRMNRWRACTFELSRGKQQILVDDSVKKLEVYQKTASEFVIATKNKGSDLSPDFAGSGPFTLVATDSLNVKSQSGETLVYSRSPGGLLHLTLPPDYRAEYKEAFTASTELAKAADNTESTVAAATEEPPLTADEVIALQKALAFFSLYKGGIDGDAGPNTQRAVNQWLRKQGRSPETLRLSLAEEITAAAKTEKALIAKAEEEKQRQAEAERQLAAAKEAEARRKAEEEERRQLAAAKEAEAKRKAEEARQKAEEERRQAEAVRLAAEKERKEQEEKERQLALAKEAEAKRKAEEEKQRQAEAERQLAAAKEAEQKRKAEEEKRNQQLIALRSELLKDVVSVRDLLRNHPGYPQKAGLETAINNAILVLGLNDPEAIRSQKTILNAAAANLEDYRERQIALADAKKKEEAERQLADAKRKAEEEKQKAEEARLAKEQSKNASDNLAGLSLEFMDKVFQVPEATNIRAAPKVLSKRVGRIGAGQTLTILAKISGEHWYLVETDQGERGFVFADAITLASGEKKVAVKVKNPAIPDLDYGDYYALVIGNNTYPEFTDLQSAVNDAKAVSTVLKVDYGFNVKLLEDASRSEILRSLKHLRETARSEDNVLIYYAGHGHLDREENEGYWLPVDADRDDPTNWILTDRITSQVKAMKAKHVMVVADSCFSGTITRAIKIEQRTPEWLSEIVRKKARTALTSGGLEPVLDSGSGNHSAFAHAFISLLEGNDGVLDASQLFSQLRPKVMVNSTQTPQYGNIHQAGHDGGDFLFVRQ